MLRFETPAPVFEALPLIAQGTRFTRFMRRIALMQALESETVLFRAPNGEAIAVLGFYPMPDEEGREVAEVWFACLPDLAGHMLGFVRAARLTCARMAEHGSVVLRALVREGHAPGARIATLSEFERVGVQDGWELWEWSGCNVEYCEGDQACSNAAAQCAQGGDACSDSKPIGGAATGSVTGGGTARTAAACG